MQTICCIKTTFHKADFSSRSDIFFCLKTNWRRVDVEGQKKISFRAENSAYWKTTFRLWLNGNAMFYETFFFVSMSVKQSLFVSVFVHKCLMMLNDAEYTTFKMFITQMSNYLFVISFHLMLYKTLRYRLARALAGGAM